MSGINIFSTRTMLEALRVMYQPQTFMLDTFFTNVKVVETEFIDIDIQRGTRRMAPFVSENNQSKNVESHGYETQTYKPPRISVKIPTTAEQLLKRLPGELPYTNQTPISRAAKKLTDDLQELSDMIRRREEWMATRALFDGKLHLVNKEDGVDQTMDFGLTNKEKVSNKWSDALKCTPIDDLWRWRRAIMHKTGISPDVAIMSPETAKAFVNSEQVQKIVATFRNFIIPELNPRIISKGITFYARIPEIGVSIYSYDEWYYDEEANKEKPMVEPGKVLLASTSANFHLFYGACPVNVNGEFGIVGAPRVPRSWTENDPPIRQIAIDSKPLTVPYLIDSIYVGEVF